MPCATSLLETVPVTTVLLVEVDDVQVAAASNRTATSDDARKKPVNVTVWVVLSEATDAGVKDDAPPVPGTSNCDVPT